jgi:hypothetical protein
MDKAVDKDMDVDINKAMDVDNNIDKRMYKSKAVEEEVNKNLSYIDSWLTEN